MQLSIYWRRMFLVLLLFVIPLFFIGGPSQYSLEIYRRLWDLGHPGFFAILSFLLIGYGVIKHYRHFVIAFLLVFIGSIAIEKLQTYVGRTASWFDILFNLSGFLLGGIFLAKNYKQKLIVIIVATIGLLPGLWKVFKSVMLCWTLWQQFPVLLDGNSPWEGRAWGSAIKLQQIPGQSGYLLAFDGKAYHSADMMGFMQSWQGYRSLTIELENLSNDAFNLTLRISDKRHERSNQEYTDRFNGRLLIQPGKQTVQINLTDVETAPRNRKMDLDEIYLLKLFLSQDDKPHRVKLHKIYLGK